MPPQIVLATQCFYPDTGGIEGLMTALADNCHKAGYGVTVFADRVRTKGTGALPAKPYAIHRAGGPRPWRRWRKRNALASHIKDAASSIAGIFTDSWKSVAALPQALSAPVAVLAHGMEFPPNPAAAKTERIRAALRRSAAVVASSSFTAGLVYPYLDPQSARLEIIHPPVVPPSPPSSTAIGTIRDRLGGRAPAVVTISRLEPRKGVDAVIRVVPALLRRHPGLVYAVAGAGSDRPRLESLARELGVSDSVLFLGRITEDEKAALLAQATLFAMPVRREGRSVEGFGISYLEAACFGVPAVAGADGGASDAVLDGETGLICDGADEQDVAVCLLRLLDDEGMRRRLGASAKSRVFAKLCWDVAFQRYMDLFDQAGEAPRQSGADRG